MEPPHGFALPQAGREPNKCSLSATAWPPQNHNWKMGKSETCRLLCSSLLQSQEESQKVHATFCNSCEVGPGIGQREVTGQWLRNGQSVLHSGVQVSGYMTDSRVRTISQRNMNRDKQCLSHASGMWLLPICRL